jgi:hypothetical protein
LDYFKAKFTETPFDGVSPWFPDVSGEDFPKKTNPMITPLGSITMKDYQSAASSSALSPMELYSMQAPWCFVTAVIFAMATAPRSATWDMGHRVSDGCTG